MLAAEPAWALNKCVSSDGKVTYQEHACAKTERAAVVPLPPTQVELDRKAEEKSAQAAREAAEQAKKEASAAYAKLMQELDQKRDKAEAACGKPITGAPTVGMPEENFLRCTAVGLFGSHTVNETQTAGIVSRQYFFKDIRISLGIRYVYVRNGVVNAIQR